MFFVQSCAVCNAETENGVFCPACRRSELLIEAMPGLLNLDGAVMGYKYSGALKEMLHKLKFECESKFLQPLAEEAAFLAQAYSESCFDMVVSVPTDAARRRQRGFDIPESIFAQALAVKGTWQPQVLARIKATAPQYGLAPDKRRSNVRGCFEVRGSVSGAKILLVDDDTTFCLMLKTLKQAGAKSVYALTLCGSLENFKE